MEEPCKEKDSLTMTNYDDTVAFLGQWGRFQRVVFFLLCASIVPNGFGAFTLVFLTDTPTHHCMVPDVNLTKDWRETIIPTEVRGCRRLGLTHERTRYNLLLQSVSKFAVTVRKRVVSF